MSESFETLLEQAQAGQPGAQHLLAIEYARRGQLTRARRWLRSAAEAKHGDSINELALMALHGVGETSDPAIALKRFRQASDLGSAEAAYQLATLSYTRGLHGISEDESESYLRLAASRDFPAALRVMGMLAISEASQRKLGFQLLSRAAWLGDSLAQHTLGKKIRQAGQEDPQQWLVRAAKGGAYVSQTLVGESSIELQPLSLDDAPPLPDIQNWSWPTPRALEKTALNDQFEAYSVNAILSPEECEYLINIASPLMRRSATIDPATGKLALNELRTSSSMNFDSTTQDIVLEWIEHRMAATAGQPVSHGEPLSILRYRGGEEYQPHYDYITLDSAEAEREFATNGQRLVTIFSYLTSVPEGGATSFPELAVEVPAIQGNAVMFRNCDDGGVPDSRSLHAGRPVIRGEKWLAVLWLRDRPWSD